MPPEKVAEPLIVPPRSIKPQWLRGVFVGAGLFAVGNWAASQYANGGMSNSVLDYVKSTVGGSIPVPNASALTEPWSKVRFHLIIHLGLRVKLLRFCCEIKSIPGNGS